MTEKNKDNLYDEPFTNSAEQGIISQKDYFDREVVNEENLDGYYVVQDNDFVYNPRVSVTAPVGPINRNKLGRNGVMSPLYTVFRIHDVDAGYLEYYFKTTSWHRFMKLNGDSGARFDRFSIASSLFMEMPIPYPNIEEQARIGEYFDTLDTLITLHQRKKHQLPFCEKYVWEQRKLGNVVDVCSGKDYKHLDDGDIPVYGTGGYMLSVSEALSESNDAIGIGRKGTIDNPYILKAPFWTVDTLFYCIPKEKYDLNFLFAVYQNINWKAMDESTGVPSLSKVIINNVEVKIPPEEEQRKIGKYFTELDYLITLHQCKCGLASIFGVNDWEQRKLGDFGIATGGTSIESEFSENGKYKVISIGSYSEQSTYTDQGLRTDKTEKTEKRILNKNDLTMILNDKTNTGRIIGRVLLIDADDSYVFNQRTERIEVDTEKYNPQFLYAMLNADNIRNKIIKAAQGNTQIYVNWPVISEFNYPVPIDLEEQKKLGEFFGIIDKIITLHQYKHFRIIKITFITYIQRKPIKCVLKVQIQVEIITKEMIIMPELEAMIEQKLIEQLVYGDSQWTYREDLKTEEDLWANFRYILEQNNKDRLDGESLSDSEFEQVKNQLQFSSFYKAGEWLVGENGKVQVHVQRDTKRLHLVVMNHEHIAGGSSVYEVINQYSALKNDDDGSTTARDRRFDVTLMINGLPMIHIELKNKQHSYMDGFWQIKKYIGEGKFTGIFSAVQMFVISNGINTKYFSAASDTELNPKFISGWLDKDNNPVAHYLDFAKSVLRIPEAHEMISRYTVLDEDAKRLILLRPYQIHAIESIREASKCGKSGYVWHTTGSGKTLTSYKATRNLLMDIPAIDKAIFLIDRKDLDTQTTMAFQAYANNDLIDVDETDNVNDLKKKLKSDDRQVIVTTIQKLQRMITKRLAEGTPEYNKIKNLKIAFVVDECHRAVTPSTKRELERFFGRSLWFGFTGTPRFAENPYPQLGDLPRTTEELYGERLHKYTIQNAIHDNSVLGFQVEHNGPKNVSDETDSSVYDNETHMLKVLDVILNKSYHKLGFQNGKGKTYEALLTTSSIQLAQRYYDLLTRVKNGETSIQIDEKVKQVLPDFPKFAITYSVTENEEGSHVNQQKMQASLDDYNNMFGTKYEISQIQGYNGNLNKRLARKDAKFKSRNEQLDLVIVVDRLLTGFDAPCLSTIFIDRQPMGPHDLIQAFSRTNRIFDKNKSYGQIVTFQAPVMFKQCVDDAIKLYSAGGTKDAIAAEWEEIEPAFKKALAALRISAEKPSDILTMSRQEKKIFVKMFQSFDKLFAQLKSFTQYEDSMLEGYGITDEEYYDYAAHYLNVVEELKADDPAPDDPDKPDDPMVDQEYELMAYSNTKIDYEYIINLIQNIVTPGEDEENNTPEERQKKIEEVKQYVEELRKENPKVADIMSNLIYEIELDENKYKGQSILNIVENMKSDCIDKVITDFCVTWYASKEDVMYAATHYRNGMIPNESAIKATIDYTSYKAVQERALPKFKYYAQMMADLRKTLEEEIKPLTIH